MGLPNRRLIVFVAQAGQVDQTVELSPAELTLLESLSR